MDDAQEVADEEWVSEACNRGWCGLTKDQKLWRLLDETQWIPVFSLSNGNLGAADMVARFEASRAQIWRRAGAREVGLWIVYEDGKSIHRRFPK